MLLLLIVFTALFLIIAIVCIPSVDRNTGMIVARVIMALMVFVLSADLIGAWRQHRVGAEEIKQIRNRLMIADSAGYPIADVLLAFIDYNAAIESAPESVPFVYRWYREELEERWRAYQSDRTEARLQRVGQGH